MFLKNRLSLLISLFTFFAGSVISAPIIVNTAEDLVAEITNLSDGDTIFISAGYYNISSELAPSGLFIAGNENKPYHDVTILGAGRDKTILDFDDSYGVMVFYSQNTFFKNLTIKNAKINGGIYVFESIISMDSVKIDSCASVSSDIKEDADGGGLCFDKGSSFESITHCIFSNNSAEHNGGAIAYLNPSSVSGVTSIIDKCQFYNNTSPSFGSALYFFYMRRSLYFRQNVVFNNTGPITISLKGRSSVIFKNNSIVLNSGVGLYVHVSLAERFYFDNNVVVNNSDIDCRGTGTNISNYYKGWFNVCGSSYLVNYEGFYNDIVSSKKPFYTVKHDSLLVTQYGAGLLAGRVSSSKKMSEDIYGQTWTGVGDVGAIKVPLGDSISVWTGSDDHDFMNASNWKAGLVPSSTVRSTKKIIISNCDSLTYPIIDKAVEATVLGDFSGADLYVCATGVLSNEGEVNLDTLCLESQSGGSAQFLNKGTLTAQARLSEHYLLADVTKPVYFPDYTTPVNGVLANATFGADYSAFSFDEADLLITEMSAGDLFSQDKGYWVKSETNSTMVFKLPTEYKETFNLQHTKKTVEALSGWNAIGNPYDAPLVAAEVIANSGNSEKVASAFYTFSDGHFKAFVDSIGDEEGEVIMPHSAFYVKMLDVDYTTELDNISFVLDTGDIIIQFTKEATEVISKGELMNVSLYDNRSALVDKTYIRFKDEATDQFDNKYDAYKLDHIFNRPTEQLFSTMPFANEAYAVNSSSIDKDDVKSLNLNINCPASLISASQTNKLVFDLSGNDLGYLLHDSKKDSSESVILNDEMEFSFTTGIDSAALFNRFSLQIFEDTIPNRIVSVNVHYAEGYEYHDHKKEGYILDKEIKSVKLESIALVDNPDTVFYIYSWVDSIFVDSTSYDVAFNDSIVLDSTISDTSRVLGTYDYIVRHVEVTKTTFAFPDTTITGVASYVKLRNYTLSDTALVSSVSLLAEKQKVKIISNNGMLTLNFPDEDYYNVELYNMSGSMICHKVFVMQGQIADLKHGVYILSVRSRNEQLSYKIVVD